MKLGESYLPFTLGSLLLFWVGSELAAQPTWKRVYGGGQVEQVWDIAALEDGGFAVLGSTGSFGASSSDVYLFKLDENGSRQWSRLIGGPHIEEGRALVELPGGGLLIVGSIIGPENDGYDGLVIRTNEIGEVQWQRIFGGGDWDRLFAVDQDGAGGIWTVGTTYSAGVGGDVWLLHLDPAGEVLLETIIGGEGEDTGASVISTPDGGCVVAGSRVSENGDEDMFLIKVDADGSEEWSNVYGGDDDDGARDVEPTSDGGYSLMGWTRSFNSVIEQYHVKVNGSGALDWERNWGQVSDQEGFDHLQLSSGEFASIGYVSQGGAGGKDMFLLKTTHEGEFILGQTQGGEDDDLGRAIVRAEGGYVIGGITRSYGQGQWDVMVIRTDEVGFTASDEVIEEFDPVAIGDKALPTLHVGPNPSDGMLYLNGASQAVTWQLFDVLGRPVRSGLVNDPSEGLNCHGLNGTFHLHVETNGNTLFTTVVITN